MSDQPILNPGLPARSSTTPDVRVRVAERASALPLHIPPATRPLTIAFFVEGMYASGVDTSSQLLAAALREQGHRVVMFVPWKEHCGAGRSDVFLLSSVRVNSKQGVNLSYPISLKLLNKFKETHFDLIHIHTSTSVNFLAWQVSALFGLPLVYTYHTMTKEYMHYWDHLPEALGSLLDPLLDSAVEKFDQIICNKADAVITPSAKAARYLAGLAVTPPVTVIPNGIKLDNFYPWPSDELQTRFGLPADAKVLLWVGRLNQEKRPLLAYELFRTLCRRRDDVYLVMVGDGALRAELEERRQRDGLQKRLFLTGLVNYKQMAAIYNSADLWLSTSQSEVHPMVALEAIACGLPTIAWRDPALDGVIDDGVNGFLINSSQEFATRMMQILDDGALYQQMHRAALAKRQEYSIETTAERVAQVYAQVLTPQRPAHPLLPFRTVNGY
ncbi:MAG: glycosyltransferase [Caldilineaceae bacterium]|nr:glycosyltransferase [Caldilineaceae bacterium]